MQPILHLSHDLPGAIGARLPHSVGEGAPHVAGIGAECKLLLLTALLFQPLLAGLPGRVCSCKRECGHMTGLEAL